MSVAGAMKTAVSGLMANSTAVARISENIANSATVGYKRTFASMVTDTAPGAGSVSGVQAANGSDVAGAGLVSATGVPEDLAVSGEGFFVVSKNPDDPLLSNYFLTRAGSFRADDSGYMVNSAGYYLAGYQFDDTGNLPVIDRSGFAGLSTVRVGEMTLAAQPSTAATVTGNLPAQETGSATPGSPFVSSMEFYTQLGRSENLQLSWQPTSTNNVWDLTISDTTGAVHGTVAVTFQNAGTTPGAPASYAVSASQPNGAKGLTVSADGVITLSITANGDPMAMTLSLGTPGTYDGVQQFVGDFSPQKFKVDGSGQAALSRTETDNSGVVWGVFEDGRRKALYEVPLAQVTNPNAMTLVAGNAWQVTRAAGDMTLGKAGTGSVGIVVSGALEASTVDIATELTDLITVQRAYSSNAKIITTADEMLQEVGNIKR